MTRNLPNSFNELIHQSELPVLVDFWAEWCGPCRMLSPTIEKIASELKGRLLTVKVNVDQKPHVANQYNIRSIPTVMLFHRGQGIMRMMGAQPYEVLKAEILKHLT
ncbi:thioredoxin [candidate division KSB1 bacterium]|nr:thioredoxin [candidate division KSB1 bacterium]